jgi:hypothetical protein
VLHLVIASGYLSKLVGNRDIKRYLGHHHPELLTEVLAIIAAASLDQAGGCGAGVNGNLEPVSGMESWSALGDGRSVSLQICRRNPPFQGVLSNRVLPENRQCCIIIFETL